MLQPPRMPVSPHSLSTAGALCLRHESPLCLIFDSPRGSQCMRSFIIPLLLLLAPTTALLVHMHLESAFQRYRLSISQNSACA